ncbi:MAG TPA: ribonuclease III [Candidatus Aminicenantes bacterium]|nr:ribonuclease III [Candidatus Aminicenantes bacterium]HRY65353.1 ribonuclease III [Candidatus Aminicenantes bacterium]HRZ72179.1 ribonuclease III [Candidatus Aminicenantes bacterium]
MKRDAQIVERLEKAAGYSFKDRAVLEKALTHSSYAFEARAAAPGDNEQLEFLGDSVVGLVAAEFFLRAFPERSEGELSKLKASSTSTLALAQLARAVKLDRAIRLGRGEEKSGGRKKVSILAGAFEALAGAIYLDGGFDAARAFISRSLGAASKPIKSDSQTINNAKSALQEICQKAGLAAPVYRLVGEKGPAHKRTFTVEVCLGEKVLARSKGASKKAAEQAAAEKALRSFFGRKIKRLSPEAFVIEADDLVLP